MDDFLTAYRNKDGTSKPPRADSRAADMQKFVDYWSGMRRNGDVPRRTEIDPRGIESLLSNAFIAEKIAPGLARLRIAGTHLSDVMGMEVRGMPLSALIDPEDRAQLSDAVVELFERPAQLRLELAAPGGIRRAALAATLIVLPLRSDLGDVSRALGCLVSTGDIGTTPRRFKILECHVTPIDLNEATKAPGLAEEQAPFVPQVRPAPAQTPDATQDGAHHRSERPYLRLVHSS